MEVQIGEIVAEMNFYLDSSITEKPSWTKLQEWKDKLEALGGWTPVSIPAPKDARLLTYSPVYPEGNPMRYRTMDEQFLKLCEEVTHYIVCAPPKESCDGL